MRAERQRGWASAHTGWGAARGGQGRGHRRRTPGEGGTAGRSASAAPLTVPAAGEEGHAVDGDGHGAVLAVEVVDVVGGAEAGGDPGPLGRPQQQQQQQERQQRWRRRQRPGQGGGAARAPPRPAPPGGHLGPGAAASQPHGRGRGRGATQPREAPLRLRAPGGGIRVKRRKTRAQASVRSQRNQLDPAGESGVRGAATPRCRTPGSIAELRVGAAHRAVRNPGERPREGA